MKKLELLSPARNLECGIAAINHGADAVYIGASRFGARKAAGNSMEDIERLASYGKKFNVNVYLTLNTILMDNELEHAEKTARDAWNAGISALIVQDMAFMEMNLPPVRLFASTQTDNRTPEKILFLENAGFDRVILARELGTEEIKKIRAATTVGLEAFVHGAVCYSYSGRCYLSAYIGGRSANRGECGQPCRLQWDLENSAGDKIIRNRHLMSLKDMDRSGCLEDLVDAGITSFKIEGRLKDSDYVKNITAFYRKKLDMLLEGRKDLLPSSSGRSVFFFEPDPYRTFNRGLHSFLAEEHHSTVFSAETPKSMGRSIGFVKRTGEGFIEIEIRTSEKISNGDGLCFINEDGSLKGFQVEKTEGSRIYFSSGLYGISGVQEAQKSKGSSGINNPSGIIIKKGQEIFRNRDHAFLKLLSSGRTSERKIGLDMIFSETDSGFRLWAEDVDGIASEVFIETEKIPAEKPETALQNIENQLSRLGDSIFYKKSLKIESQPFFISLKLLNQMRRDLASSMENARMTAFHTEKPSRLINSENGSKNVQDALLYPETRPDFSANISNRMARKFYLEHGVTETVPGFEAAGYVKKHASSCLPENSIEITSGRQELFLMHSRHCILKDNGLCLKNSSSRNPEFYITHRNLRFRIRTDCPICEMYLEPADSNRHD